MVASRWIRPLCFVAIALPLTSALITSCANDETPGTQVAWPDSQSTDPDATEDTSDNGSDTGDSTDTVLTPDTKPTPEDTTPAPECATDENCLRTQAPGPCENSVCQEGVCVLLAKAEGSACEDGNICTEADTCVDGSCTGTPLNCDDSVACTDDQCDPEAGGCVWIPLSGPVCDDGDPCTEESHCIEGSCQGGLDTCECQTDTDCAELEDNNACNGTLVCKENVCVIDPASIVTCDNTIGSTCLSNECVPETGNCFLSTAPDGKACDDGSVCTSDEACSQGICIGYLLNCADGNSCTQDTCDPVDGCVYASISEGEACTNDNVCTTDGVCVDGSCDGQLVSCDDGNPCTDDSCDGTLGCVHTANELGCEDGNACTTNDHCLATLCLGGEALNCDDNNPCTEDTCAPDSGCSSTPNSVPCDDNDPCTLNDKCDDSACQGTSELPCDDGNECTDDSCVAGVGCSNTHNSADCDDGNSCSEADVCEGGTCVGGPSSCGCESTADCAPFEDGDSCNGTLICDKNSFPFSCKVDPVTVITCDTAADSACLKNVCTPNTGICSPQAVENSLPCDDENACTSDDSCANGVCVGGAAPNCNDDDPCTVDACDPTTGCTHTPSSGASCDDGNACTTGDECVAGSCTGGSALPCNDSSICTVDTCDVFEGCQYTNVGLPCNDGDPCTVSDVCFAGKCAGKGAPDCDDNNVCTADTCSSGQGGCVHLPIAGSCDDGNACTTDATCAEGECQAGQAISCNDDKVCTTDLCDPASGCVFEQNTDTCSDDNECTSGDICTGGVCGFTAPTTCEDNNDCTQNACDPEEGCVFVPTTKVCNDGDPCTTNDTCTNGECVGDVPTNCNDGNPCTDDVCVGLDGCDNIPNTAPCNDGNPCTNIGICADSTCQPGLPLPCNDGNPCTDDICSPAAGGCAYTPNDGVCTDDNACTLNDTCEGSICQPGSTELACDDGVPCTDDFCDPLTGCTHAPNTATCDDGNPCTEVDTCADLFCSGTGEVDCDDSNPCTDDSCVPSEGCVHQNNEDPCDDGNTCTGAGVCSGGVCVADSGSAFCCEENTDCDDGSACTADQCVNNVCQNTPLGTPFFEETFDSGEATGFTFTTEMESPLAEPPLVQWQIDTSNTASGSHSLYWGNIPSYSYDHGGTISEAIIEAFPLPYSPAILSFQLYMDVEDKTDDCDFDVLTIYADDTFVHEECESTFGWKRVHVDLSAFAGRSVTLNFTVDTGDEEFNSGQGIWIDDLVLMQGDCNGQSCTNHAECNDFALCSGGACVDGQCNFLPSPPNQSYSESFEDILIGAGSAAQGWSFGSNNSDLAWQISDASAGPNSAQSLYAGNAAAQNYNFGPGVVSATLPEVRIANNLESTLIFRLQMDVADPSCDNDVLSIKVGDKVMAQFCESTGGKYIDAAIVLNEFSAQDIQPVFEFATDGNSGDATGVFVDDVALVMNMTCGSPKATFDDNIAFNFLRESNSETVYWHLSEQQAFTPTRSLHAANPATHNYDSDQAVDARATTAVNVCPTGLLSFRLRNTLADQSCDDVLTVEVGNDILLTECTNTDNNFVERSVDLSDYAEMTIPVTFRFQTNASNNNAEGPYIDEVVLSCP